MNVCSDGHDEICYTGSACPCCLLISEVEELKVQLDDSDAAYRDARDELDNHVCVGDNTPKK